MITGHIFVAVPVSVGEPIVIATPNLNKTNTTLNVFSQSDTSYKVFRFFFGVDILIFFPAFSNPYILWT